MASRNQRITLGFSPLDQNLPVIVFVHRFINGTNKTKGLPEATIDWDCHQSPRWHEE